MKQLDLNLFTVISAIVITVIFFSLATYSRNVKQDELFAKNMEIAIGKGIDPIAVKCAYGEARNEICITYIMNHK
jgi:uncharacterized PurR-regulated membrane protein YhhQ (DUF165 family)